MKLDRNAKTVMRRKVCLASFEFHNSFVNRDPPEKQKILLASWWAVMEFAETFIGKKAALEASKQGMRNAGLLVCEKTNK